MRKKILAVAAIACMGALLLTGCDGAQNDTVKISKYKKLQVEKVEKQEVTNEAITEDINSRLMETATHDEVKREAKDGDYVTIDYVGKIDNKAFDGGTAEGEEVQIGSGTYIQANGEYKGFEEQLIGHKAGDKFKIKVQFPSDYSDELKDKIATFDITLKAVKEENIPELTDDWVKKNSETAKTVAEFKDEIKKELEKDNEDAYKNTLSSEVLEVLLKNTEWVKKPDDKIETAYEESMTQYKEYAESAGLSVEKFISQYMGSSYDDFTKQMKNGVEENVKQTEAISLIAEKENIKVDEKDYKSKATALAKDYGFEDLAAFEKEYTKETIQNYFVQEKVLDFLVKNCEQVKGLKTEEATEASTESNAATESTTEATNETNTEATGATAVEATEGDKATEATESTGAAADTSATTETQK